MVYDIGINDMEARKSLQMFSKDVRNATNATKENVRAAKRMGDEQRVLKERYEGSANELKAYKDLLKQQQEILDHSQGAEKQQIDLLKQQMETTRESIRLREHQNEAAGIALKAEQGNLANLNHEQERSNELRKANLKQMEAEGKQFGVIEGRVKSYSKSIEEAEAKIQLLQKSLSGLKGEGLQDSSKYANNQVELAKVRAQQAQDIKERNKLIERKPEDYAIARSKGLKIDKYEKQSRNNYSINQLRASALKGTGNEEAALELEASSRVQRMSDLSEIIKRNQTALTKSVENTDTGVKMQKTIEKATKEYGELEDAQRRYEEGLNDLNWANQKNISTMNTLSRMYEANGQHFRAQLVQSQTLRQEVDMLKDQYERERVELGALSDKYGENSSKVTEQKRKVSELGAQMVNLNKRIIEVDRSTGGAYGKLQKFADYASQHSKAFGAIGTGLQTVGKGMSMVGVGAGLAVAQGTKLNFQLEQTNNTTKALLQNAGREDPSEVVKNLTKAKKEDIELSEKYGISQNDIAQAQQTLAHRGYESNQVLAASKPLLQSAIATGYSLHDVTNIATSAVEAFGLRSKDTATMTKNTTKAINTMSYASDLSASSFNDTGVALSYVGSTAKAAGVSMDQTAAAVGELSLNGIGAQKAGTGLRKILQSLISPTANGKKVIEQLGLQIKDSHGKLLPFNQIMEELHDKMENMTKVQKVDLLKQLFGTTGQTAAAALVNNADALSKFNKEVAKANGDDYIGKLSKQKLDNPINQINRLKAAWQEMSMSMASSFGPAVTGAIKGFTNILDMLNNASPGVKKMFNYFVGGVAAVGGVLFVLGSFLKHINSLTTNWSAFTALFSKKAKNSTSSAQLMNDAIIKQIEEMKVLNEQLEKNNELNAFTGDKTGGRTSSSNSGSNNLSNDIADLEKDGDKVGENAKVSRWTRFKSRFGSFESTGTRFGKVGKDLSAGEEVASDATKLGKFGRVAKIAGGGIAGIDVATSLLDLLGTNKKNVGDHVGGATGSLTGTAIGGLIGSIVPGAGTAVGAAAGGWAGDWLGRKIGDSIQSSLKKSSPEYKQQQKVKQQSKGTQDSVKDIEKLFDKINTRRDKADDPNSTKVAKGDIKDYQSMQQAVQDFQKAEQKSSNKDADTLLKEGLISKKVANQMRKNGKHALDGRVKDANDAIQELITAEQNGGKGRAQAIKDANTAISKLYQTNYSDRTAQSKKFSDQQKIIFGELSNSSKNLSKSAMQSMLKDSYNNMQGQIKNAKKTKDDAVNTAQEKYKKAIDIANNERYVQGTISQKQYNDIVSKAQSTRDDAVQAATDKQQKVVDQATTEHDKILQKANDQSKKYLKDIDYETGQTISKWQKVLIWLGLEVNPNDEKKTDIYKVHNNMNDVNKDVTKQINKSFGKRISRKKSQSTYGFDINSVEDSIDKDVNKNSYTGYAEGSDAIRGNQQALVNEKGQESAYNPKTNRFRLFNGGPQVTTLYDGERILNAQDTYKMLHGGLGNGQTLKGYANGTTTLGSDSGSQSSVKLKNVKSLDKFKKKSKDIWKSIHDDTKDKVDKTHDYTAKQLADMKKKSLNQFQGIHDGTINNTKDLVKNYNSIFGQLPTMTQSSVRGSIDQLNRGFAGINSTLNQFGSKNNVLQPIHYATGSNGAVAREHDAIVNDAMNGSQQEAILRNDGIFLPKYRNALVHLNAGDAVLNGSQTRNFLKGTGIAHYANGSGVSNEQLKKLISQGMANSTGQLAKDFGSKIGKVGSQLGTGYLDDTKGALNGQMAPWYKAIFQVLNDAEGNGTSASAFLKYAKENFAGKKYSLGADGPDLYDCSSMVEAALKHFGIQLGRTTTAMQASSQLTRLGDDISKARPGDLALFGHGDGAAGHVGIVNNPATGTMFNETPPAAGVTNIGDVTSVALDGFYRINALADKDTYKKSPLFGLAKKQLGKQRLDWVQKHLGNFGDFAGYIPTGDHASLLRQAGIPESDWSDFNYIISHESGWNVNATNPDGGAYGLPQALPASKMASAGDDWRNNPITQLKWMKGYINGRYGSADAARAYWQAHHNYENGGLITNEQIARVGEHNKPEMILPLTDKFRTVQLAKQAVDFVTASDRNQFKSGSSNVTSAQMEKDIANLNKNVDELVKAVNIIAQNSGLPTKAYITRQDLFKTINDGNKKAQMQAALRRGENIVQ